jgi:hypothetical protein
MFGNDIINLKLNMTEFKEEVFLGPLSESNGLVVNLSPGTAKYFILVFQKWIMSINECSDTRMDPLAARILCGCYIAWLVRDNPSILPQVNNGICTDGRPFESIPLEDFSCCKTIKLILFDT